jgi:hypothetical protein
VTTAPGPWHLPAPTRPAPSVPAPDVPLPDVPLPVLPTPGEEAGFTLARIAGADVVAVLALRLTHAPAVPAWAVLAVLTLWALTPVAHAVSALAGAGVTWLLGTGFVEHPRGDLSFAAADRWHLAAMAAVAALALLLGHRARAARTARRAADRAAGRLGEPPDPWCP